MRRALLQTLLLAIIPLAAHAQGALLVVTKQSHALAIVDGATLHVLARIPIGEDPHEVIVGPDRKTAYVSNYGEGTLHTLAVVDLPNQKPLPPIDLAPLRGPHGLTLHNETLWFTAEGSKALGTLNPETRQGRDRSRHRTRQDPPRLGFKRRPQSSGLECRLRHHEHLRSQGGEARDCARSSAPSGLLHCSRLETHADPGRQSRRRLRCFPGRAGALGGQRRRHHLHHQSHQRRARNVSCGRRARSQSSEVHPRRPPRAGDHPYRQRPGGDRRSHPQTSSSASRSNNVAHRESRCSPTAREPL